MLATESCKPQIFGLQLPGCNTPPRKALESGNFFWQRGRCSFLLVGPGFQPGDVPGAAEWLVAPPSGNGGNGGNGGDGGNGGPIGGASP